MKRVKRFQLKNKKRSQGGDGGGKQHLEVRLGEDKGGRIVQRVQRKVKRVTLRGRRRKAKPYDRKGDEDMAGVMDLMLLEREDGVFCDEEELLEEEEVKALHPYLLHAATCISTGEPCRASGSATCAVPGLP